MRIITFICILILALNICTFSTQSVLLEAKRGPPFEEISESTVMAERYEPSVLPSAIRSAPILPESKEGVRLQTIVMQSDQFPISIDKGICYPNRDLHYINESICIYVQADFPNVNRKSPYVKIWEHTQHGLNIEKCNYPLRTSSQMEIIKYKTRDSSKFYDDDILDPLKLAELMNNASHQFSKEIKNISDVGKLIVNLSNPTKEKLVLILNSLVDYKDLYKLQKNVSHLRDETRYLGRAIAAAAIKNLTNEDLILYNRLLIEDAYPELIQKNR